MTLWRGMLSCTLVLHGFLCTGPALAAAHSDKKHREDQESMRPNPAAASFDGKSMVSCPAGSPLGEVQLLVRSSSSGQTLPFQNILHLTEGDTVLYTPIERGKSKREGEVALVLVPTRISNDEQLIVTDAHNAAKPAEWNIPRSMALAALVYGPGGLSRSRVKSFLSKDSSLVAQLAEYADKTSETEALIAALSDSESSAASVNAALNGFASQYGVSTEQIDRTAPPSAQAQTLLRTMNPQLASYSPLATNTAAGRAQQTASLATAAAGMFFGSPVGLLAGGTSMLLDLRSIAFPDTVFRSAFATGITSGSGNMQLCGERGKTEGHVRLAYLWATRVPNAPKPQMEIGDANYLPRGQKNPLPVTLGEIDWKFLQRARGWYLEGSDGKRWPTPLVKLQNQGSVELDLAKASGAEGGLSAGSYKLGGLWDWTPFQAKGEVHVVAPGSLSAARLQPASQDALVASGSRVALVMSGGDFEFTTKVEFKSVHDDFAPFHPVPFRLPGGLRKGPQGTLEMQVDTHDIAHGEYRFYLTQDLEGPDGKKTVTSVPFLILPAPPTLTNLPIVVNAGEPVQHFVLKGEHLEAITRLESDGVQYDLDKNVVAGGTRDVTVKLTAELKPGGHVPVRAYVKDRAEPLLLKDALAVTGPLPTIVGSRLAPPPQMPVALQKDEWPAGVSLSGVLNVKNLTTASTLQAGCAGGTNAAVRLHLGEQTSNSRLQQISPDQLYLLLDTSVFPAGCKLEATVDNGAGGRGKPYPLAQLSLLPLIGSLDPAMPSGYQLRGRNLEMIEKAGWDTSAAVPIDSLPAPVPGSSQEQVLTLPLGPPPAGKDSLLVWLRGDVEPRITTTKAPAPKPMSSLRRDEARTEAGEPVHAFATPQR